ncbi:MAG: class B sortase [Clostridiales bacterium]|nr:class B sortase [Clostridiales bacterium]
MDKEWMVLMKKTEWIGGLAAAVMFTAGVIMAVRVYLGYQKGIETYTALEGYYTDYPEEDGAESEDETGRDPDEDGSSDTDVLLPADAPERIIVDWEALSEQYPDCIAWIQIPAVDISYPVMQSEDNDYYLHRAPDGSYLFAGSIFMDYQNEASFLDDNTLIYGHNMRNGSMFGKLKQLNDPDVLDSCPYFWIYTPDAEYLYRIFSIHSAAINGETFTIQFADQEYYVEWVSDMADASDLDTGAEVDAGSPVVTLSTCNGNSATRQVVHGYRVWAGNTTDEAITEENHAQTD